LLRISKCDKMDIKILYKIIDKNELEVFNPNTLADYVEYDKMHKNDNGYVLIIKADKTHNTKEVLNNLKNDLEELIKNADKSD